METETDVAGRDPAERLGPPVYALYIALYGSEPLRLPSRHLLADIDVVNFGRGAPSVFRDRKDGLRRLVVQVADPLMSSRHGQLLHAHGSWMLADSDSKNGAVVAGVRTRSSKVEVGQPFSLGNTLFLLHLESDSELLDLDASALTPRRPELATFDPVFASALNRLAGLAPSELPVLLIGETGTGKEVVARAIHELSGRRGPCVAVNCGAIAPTLLEAELFGHRRGGFSGALADRLGHVRTSDRGTLFLDEIAELSLQAQVALLRVLQEREVVPVGDTLPVRVDLRVVAATHRDLSALVAAGTFREDLYARLAGFMLTLPPLRARMADLGILISALLRRRPHADSIRIPWEVATQLFRYHWPRNIRELKLVLEGMIALTRSGPITLDHLPEAIRFAQVPMLAVPQPNPSSPQCQPQQSVRQAPAGATRRGPVSAEAEAERARLVALFLEHGGNVSAVARALGTTRMTVHRLARRHGLDLRAFRPAP